jgi:hypothetical protein
VALDPDVEWRKAAFRRRQVGGAERHRAAPANRYAYDKEKREALAIWEAQVAALTATPS